MVSLSQKIKQHFNPNGNKTATKNFISSGFVFERDDSIDSFLCL